MRPVWVRRLGGLGTAFPQTRYGAAPPWWLGSMVATVTAVYLAALLIAFYGTLSVLDRRLALGVVLFAIAGSAPACWTARRRPVLCWIVGGVAAGALAGLVVVVVMTIAAFT